MSILSSILWNLKKTALAGAKTQKNAGMKSTNYSKPVAFLVVLFFLPLLMAREYTDPNSLNAREQNIEERMSKEVSVNFRETPMEDVLRILASQAAVDIIKSPEVVGSVTATLTNIPLDEALNSLLSVHGYGYTATDNIILVMPKLQIAAEKQKMVTEVYRIKYADPEDVFKTLGCYISRNGKMAFNQGSSTLMITDIESNMKDINRFIELADTETPQVLIEARIYDVTSKDAIDLGVKWNAGKNTLYPGGVDKVGVPPIGKTNPFTTGVFDGETDAAEGMMGLFRFGFLNDSLNIDALLRAEDEEVNAKLLANPSILTLDNETASIQIVTEIPFQELTQTERGGEIGTTSFREVGVMLEVTPHVTSTDQIRLHICPEFSMATGSVQVGGFIVESPQPVVDSRRADTITLVRDGQTVVVGGLKEKTLVQQTNKIPWLGDLPLVGWIFKFEGEEEVYSELLLFITPRIIRNPVITPHQKDLLDETNIHLTPRTPSLRERHDGLRRKEKKLKKECR